MSDIDSGDEANIPKIDANDESATDIKVPEIKNVQNQISLYTEDKISFHTKEEKRPDKLLNDNSYYKSNITQG